MIICSHSFFFQGGSGLAMASYGLTSIITSHRLFFRNSFFSIEYAYGFPLGWGWGRKVIDNCIHHIFSFPDHSVSYGGPVPSCSLTAAFVLRPCMMLARTFFDGRVEKFKRDLGLYQEWEKKRGEKCVPTYLFLRRKDRLRAATHTLDRIESNGNMGMW